MSAPSVSFIRESIESAEQDIAIARAASPSDPLQALRVLYIADQTLRTARAEMAAFEARVITGGKVRR